MAILGAHMSIAGGYYKAVHRAAEVGCDCVQIFTKNNNQWRAKPIGEDDAAQFRQALDELRIAHPISHDSYLINLASPDRELWKKSIDAFVIELQRAEQLSIPYVVTHPGSYTTSSESQGLKRIAKALDEVHRQTKGINARCLLETTAGQGTNLGWRFEHLASILESVKDPELIGVCVDTCHVFAAGYALAPERNYRATMRNFNKLIGTQRIKAFHLNDSKKEFGSRRDRHENIGRGCLGTEPFRLLLADRRFRKVPMYLETPKGEYRRKPWDAINLKILRDMIP